MNDKIAKAIEAFQDNKFRKALSIVEKINKNKSKQTFASLEIQAAALASMKMGERAREYFVQAEPLAPNAEKQAKICYDIFATSMLSKDYTVAERYLVKAISLEKSAKSIPWRLALANLYFQLRRYDECEALCNKLVVYKPCTIKSMHMLLDIAVARTDIDKVNFYLRQFEGRMAELTGKEIVGVYARVEAYTTLDFSKSIDKAIARGADPHVVKLIQTSKLFKEGDTDETLEMLSEIDPNKLIEENPRKRYYEIKGKIADKKGNYDEAFECFNQMNKIAHSQYMRRGGASSELNTYQKFTSFTLSDQPYEPPARMYFLVGFPRSGTTLLENVLDTQEKVLALPERPMLDDLKMHLILKNKQYPQCLESISEDELNELRELYFESVRKNSKHKDLSQFDVIIDKNPINSIRIPFIKKLFPDAKIILALRHPLDCILSCYMQNFGISPHLAEFSGWEQCFKRYKQTFDAYEGYKEYLSWDEYVIKYENVVDDFENEIEKILAFLEVEADKESYMNFNKRAKSQVITTPSASQVRQGIYKSASQRWQKYFKYIEPHLPLVEDHIERYGYSVER